MPSNSQPTPESRSKALDALDLRRDGHPWRVVAERVGFADESGARHAVDRLLSRTETEGVETFRGLELLRLDALHAAHWPSAILGDTKAAGVVLGALDRRMRLLGLAAPVAVEVSGRLTNEEFAAEAARLIGELSPNGPTTDDRSPGSGELSAESADPWITDSAPTPPEPVTTELPASEPLGVPTPAERTAVPITRHPLLGQRSQRGVPPIGNLFQP